MEEKKLGEKCVGFHGHECGGLAIGFKAALYARELLGLGRAEDEEVVCIAECDACPIDAIQVILGCTAGKGNLLFHITGKFAFSFYERRSGRAVRLMMTAYDDGLDRRQSMEFYLSHEPREIFTVTDVKLPLPEKARMMDSRRCDACGERTAEEHLHLSGGRLLCRDCYQEYDRFNV